MARTASTIREEIAELERLRKKRFGKPGLAANIAAIDERLAACREELGDG